MSLRELQAWFDSQIARVRLSRRVMMRREQAAQMQTPRGFGITPEAWVKFDAGLQRAIAETKGDPARKWPVMITFTGKDRPHPQQPVGGQRVAEFAREQQAEFEREAAEFIRLLHELGGQPIDVFWASRSLSTSVSLTALETVGRRPDVKQILLVTTQKALI